jgi:uncharacterized protein YaiI (UPF0178 family)
MYATDILSGGKVMQIWVDADACPRVIKDILFRAAERLHVSLTLVANRLLHTPPSRYLAAEVIEKGGHALDPRGEFYTKSNIGERLAVRNFMDELRSGGVDTGGPSSFSQSDRKAFANQLDRFLAKHGNT